MSTWSGISTALSSLQAQRVAMDVAGQNIANVSTPGYSRQRVDMTAGIGVDVSSIQRLHSGILGDRARTESARMGDLNVTSAVLNEIEGVFPEPSSSGFQAKLDLQDQMEILVRLASLEKLDQPVFQAKLVSQVQKAILVRLVSLVQKELQVLLVKLASQDQKEILVL